MGEGVGEGVSARKTRSGLGAGIALSALFLTVLPDMAEAQVNLNVKINFGPPPAKIKESGPYIQAARRYADAMLEYGMTSSNEPYQSIDLATKQGLKQGDPNSEQDVYRLFYLMSHVTGDAKYAETIDKGMGNFIRNRSNSSAGMMAWAEGGGSNCENDLLPVMQDEYWRHSNSRMLVAATAYWVTGIGNKETGDFNRHCSSNSVGAPYPRHGAGMMLFWMEAFKRSWMQHFLDYADLLRSFYAKYRDEGGNHWNSFPEQAGTLAYGVGLNLYAIPKSHPEHEAMRKFLLDTDENLLARGAPGRLFLHPYAQYANRYWQLMDQGEFELAARYRKAITDRCDGVYGEDKADPTGSSSIREYSMNTAQAILISLAAYQMTGEAKYLQRARYWGDYGISTFMTRYPLPTGTKTGTTYGPARAGDSDGASIPATLPMALFLLGMQVDNPDQKILWIHVPV